MNRVTGVPRTQMLQVWGGNAVRESISQRIFFFHLFIFGFVKKICFSFLLLFSILRAQGALVVVVVTGHLYVRFVQIMRWWKSNLGH